MRVYAFLVVGLFSQWVLAEDVQKLVISKYDGTEVSFLLSESPIITICIWRDPYYEDDERMKITTASHQMEFYTYHLDKMNIIRIDVTGITNLASEKESVFSWQGEALYIEIVTGNTMIAVYDVGGKKILSKSLGVGKHALSLSELPKGMNMVKIGKETLKIWNR